MKKALLLLPLLVLFAGCDKLKPTYTRIRYVNWAKYHGKEIHSIVGTENNKTLIIIFKDGSNIEILTDMQQADLCLKIDYSGENINK